MIRESGAHSDEGRIGTCRNQSFQSDVVRRPVSIGARAFECFSVANSDVELQIIMDLTGDETVRIAGQYGDR